MFSITVVVRHLLLGNLLFISFAVFASASYDSVDWVSEGVFTHGVEGPVVDRLGNLYAVNYQSQGTIGKIDRNGVSSLLIALPGNSVGNGLRFNSKGALLIADYVNHNILRLDITTKKLDVYAHQPQMNQPNDIAISSKDMIYASDPNWQNNSGQLWMIKVDGQSHLIETDMGTTNGVEVSIKDEFLYVNESVQQNVWRYELDGEGVPKNKTLFHKFSDYGLDGMRTDINGNLYIARYGAGTIAVLNPKGKLVKQYRLNGQHPTNVAFGGCDGRTLYVTMQQRGAIEKLRVKHPGRSFFPAANSDICQGEN